MTRARIVGVIGASGGVGVSTLVAALAVRAACTGRRVACLDTHRYGGGLDCVFGLDQDRGLRWRDLARADTDLDGARLLSQLPGASTVPVVSFGRGRPPAVEPEALDAVVTTLAATLDLLLIDLADPGAVLTAAACTFLDDGILVTGTTPTSLAAATAVAADLDDSVPRWWLAQRGATGRTDLADAVADALELPVVGVLPDEPRLVHDLLRARPPSGRGRYAAVAETILERLLGQERRVA